MNSNIPIGSIVTGYDITDSPQEKSYTVHQKYGIIVTSDCIAGEMYTVEWTDGGTSQYEPWEIQVLYSHAALIFNNSLGYA
jgi:hypothetical protein